ncbi:methyltransferase domain-containing protein [Mesorhizobium sp. M0239]|uniref:methyltransferase domain-containing protein n=1 Tax=unclassified Mesorhizobium TaxID=325217 RepID=UPI00333D7FC0
MLFHPGGHQYDKRTSARIRTGHSERELKRLATQATLVDPLTRDYLRRAGLRAGMHVLDVGSGAGDVAFLAADVVGPTGLVIGSDRSAEALDAARARAAQRGLANVIFHQCDPATFTFCVSFHSAVLVQCMRNRQIRISDKPIAHYGSDEVRPREPHFFRHARQGLLDPRVKRWAGYVSEHQGRS